MAGNRIELWGRVLGEPEIRTTPGGTAVVRFTVDCANSNNPLRLAVVITGERAVSAANLIRIGSAVRVEGFLRSTRRLESGLLETGFEVVANSVKSAP